MAKKSLLPHGFKAEAERTSIGLRGELGLLPHDPMSGFLLAEHLGIKIFQPDDFPLPKQLLNNIVGTRENGSAWSALTMTTEAGNKIIIHNNLHSPARCQSNLMHELAHIICKHEKPDTYKDINLPDYMRDYDKQQEEEANCLGSILQIPREALLKSLSKGKSREEIADHFEASLQMVNFRINSTGVMRQLRYLRK